MSEYEEGAVRKVTHLETTIEEKRHEEEELIRIGIR